MDKQVLSLEEVGLPEAETEEMGDTAPPPLILRLLAEQLEEELPQVEPLEQTQMWLLLPAEGVELVRASTPMLPTQPKDNSVEQEVEIKETAVEIHQTQ
ncbi:MAG: hypothetical protein CL678_16590 [Bdellovibrionaceae bacterium]|nr:hypothetical protein [Pseudobdellovibrionaceae bacterium]